MVYVVFMSPSPRTIKILILIKPASDAKIQPVI